jgi:hypothetical protein
MKKTIIIALAIMALVVTPAFAEEEKHGPSTQTTTIERTTTYLGAGSVSATGAMLGPSYSCFGSSVYIINEGAAMAGVGQNGVQDQSYNETVGFTKGNARAIAGGISGAGALQVNKTFTITKPVSNSNNH